MRFYTVSGLQLFTMAMLVSITTMALSSINNTVKEYLQLPIVEQSADGKCIAVQNFKNGDAFTCTDVGVVLRIYRTATRASI